MRIGKTRTIRWFKWIIFKFTFILFTRKVTRVECKVRIREFSEEVVIDFESFLVKSNGKETVIKNVSALFACYLEMLQPLAFFTHSFFLFQIIELKKKKKIPFFIGTILPTSPTIPAYVTLIICFYRKLLLCALLWRQTEKIKNLLILSFSKHFPFLKKILFYIVIVTPTLFKPELFIN